MNKEFFRKHFYNKVGEPKLAVLTSPLFFIGLFLKIIASFFFASPYLTRLFVPFLKYYTLSGFKDPYAYFYSLGVMTAFPYPKVMLYVMSLPGILFQRFLNPDIFTVTNFEIGIYRLPILFADIVILVIISRWLKNKNTAVLWLYWLSPVLFYINYFHGQLDVVPIMFVFVALHFLFKEKWLVSYIFLAVAIATKIHILILIPFIAIYLWRKQKSFFEIFILLDVLILIFLAINFSGLSSPEFQRMVFQNSEQFKIFSSQILFSNGTAVYLVPFAYLLLFFHNITFRSSSRDVFIMFLGFSFGILLLLIPPMPGWYYWIIPFLIYFYTKNEKFSKLGFAALNLGYFLYFLTIQRSDLLQTLEWSRGGNASEMSLYQWLTMKGIDAGMVNSVCFTFLQAVLLLNVVWIYRRGVESSMRSKLSSLPYLIGIAGDSGSGKSTFSHSLKGLFGKANVAIVAGDDMHKWERGNSMWQRFTHLNPKANELHSDVENALLLKGGDAVYRRRYDHGSGKFTLPMKLESKKVVMFEGLHSFFLGQMRDVLDLKIFIMPEEKLRVEWKLARDMKERGHAKEKVLEQLKKRADDSANYILAQEKYSDITITLRNKNKDASDSDICLEIKCKNNINFDAFVESLPPSVAIETSFSDQWQYFNFYGKITSIELEKLSYVLVPELYEVSAAVPKWSNDYNGISQLFVSYYIFSSLHLNPYAS